MVGAAFDISERFDTPVLLRITTRIAHSHTLLELGERPSEADKHDPLKYRIDRTKYVMVPGNARKRHPIIEERVEQLAQFAEDFAYNLVEMGSAELGIITNGISYQYAKEVFPQASILRLGMTYPLPPTLKCQFGGTGILTCFPSPTPFGLGLGVD